MAENPRLDIEVRTDRDELKRFEKSVNQLDKAANELARTLDKLEKEAGQSGRKLKEAGDGAGKGARSLSALDKVGRRVADQMRRLTFAVTAATTAFAVLSVKLATEFEQEMVKIETLVGLNRRMVQGWTDDVLTMSVVTGQSANSLAKALFAITSGGERGSQAIGELRAVAEATALGMGHAKDIARLGTAAVQAYGSAHATEAERVELFNRSIDTMVATVRLGNLEADELATTLGRAIGPAATLGISFEELNSFISTFSRLGVPAAEVVTSLNSTFTTLIRESERAEKSLAQYGLTLQDVRDSIDKNGFADTLVALVERYGDNVSGLQDVISNIRALRGVLGVYQQEEGRKFLEIQEATKRALGVTSEAFERQSETARQAFLRLRRAGEALLILMGNQFLPVLADWADELKNAFESGEIQKQIKGIGEAVREVLDLFSGKGLVEGIRKFIDFIEFVVKFAPEFKAAVTAVVTASLINMVVRGLTPAIAGFKTMTGGWKTMSAQPVLLVLGAIVAATQLYIDKVNQAWNAQQRLFDADNRRQAFRKELVSFIGPLESINRRIHDINFYERLRPKNLEEHEKLVDLVNRTKMALDELRVLESPYAKRKQELADANVALAEFQERVGDQKFQEIKVIANLPGQASELVEEFRKLQAAVDLASLRFTTLGQSGRAVTGEINQMEDALEFLQEILSSVDLEALKKTKTVLGRQPTEEIDEATKALLELIETFQQQTDILQLTVKEQEALNEAFRSGDEISAKYSNQVLAVVIEKRKLAAEFKIGRKLTEGEATQLQFVTERWFEYNEELARAKETFEELQEIKDKISRGEILLFSFPTAGSAGSPVPIELGDINKNKIQDEFADLWLQAAQDLTESLGKGIIDGITKGFDLGQLTSIFQSVGSTIGGILGAAAAGPMGDAIGDFFVKKGLFATPEVAKQVGSQLGTAIGQVMGQVVFQVFAFAVTELISEFIKGRTKQETAGEIDVRFGRAVALLHEAAIELTNAARTLQRSVEAITEITGGQFDIGRIQIDRVGENFIAAIAGAIRDPNRARGPNQGAGVPTGETISGQGASVQEALDELLLKILRDLESAISKGFVTITNMLDVFQTVLENTSATTLDQLAQDLEVAADIYRSTIGPLQAEVFESINQIQVAMQRAVNLGLNPELIEKAISNQLMKAIDQLAGRDTIGSIEDLDAAARMLRESIINLGLSAEETERLLREVDIARAARLQDIEIGLMQRLLSLWEKSGLQQVEFTNARAKIEQAIFKLEIAKLRAELQAWGLMTQAIANILNMLSDWAQDVGNFIATIGNVSVPSVGSISGGSSRRRRERPDRSDQEALRDFLIGLRAGTVAGAGGPSKSQLDILRRAAADAAARKNIDDFIKFGGDAAEAIRELFGTSARADELLAEIETLGLSLADQKTLRELERAFYGDNVGLLTEIRDILNGSWVGDKGQPPPWWPDLDPERDDRRRRMELSRYQAEMTEEIRQEIRAMRQEAENFYDVQHRDRIMDIIGSSEAATRATNRLSAAIADSK